LLIGVFIAQLFLDQKFKTRSTINNRYWRLRLAVTSIVCVFLTAYLLISIIAD
jgi:type II secretory pathway component PulL